MKSALLLEDLAADREYPRSSKSLRKHQGRYCKLFSRHLLPVLLEVADASWRPRLGSKR